MANAQRVFARVPQRIAGQDIQGWKEMHQASSSGPSRSFKGLLQQKCILKNTRVTAVQRVLGKKARHEAILRPPPVLLFPPRPTR